MDIFLDADNLKSLMIAYANMADDDYQSEVRKMLKKYIDIHFSCNIQGLDVSARDMFISIFLNGRGNTGLEWMSKQPYRPIKHFDFHKSDTYPNKYLSSIYMLQESSEVLSKSLSPLLFSGVGLELDTINKLMITYGEYSKSYKVKNLKRWDDINEDVNILPCTDIILCDNYIFTGYEEDNLYKLLTLLCSKTSKGEINIVIITKPTKQNQLQLTDNDYNDRNYQIKTKIKNELNKELKVTIIITAKQHDRYIITNYRYYTSGSSLNYFQKGRNIASGNTFEVKSLAHLETYNLAMEIITEFQRHIDNLIKLSSLHAIGDKKSNFFKFK